jgi:uncharacterized protein
MNFWVQTYTGKAFSLTDIKVEQIDILDIAHSLSNQCRYNGHCQRFYSVAEHCIEMSWMDKIDPLVGLLHDAAEAYVGDIVSPLKRILKGGFQPSSLKLIEDSLNRKIEKKFGLPWNIIDSNQVNYADRILCATEKRDILGLCEKEWEIELPPPLEKRIVPVLIPPLIELNFLDRFRKLTEK